MVGHSLLARFFGMLNVVDKTDSASRPGKTYMLSLVGAGGRTSSRCRSFRSFGALETRRYPLRGVWRSSCGAPIGSAAQSARHCAEIPAGVSFGYLALQRGYRDTEEDAWSFG